MSSQPLVQPVDDNAVVFDDIAHGLSASGYVIVPLALPVALTDRLFLHLKSLTDNAFQRAGIGKQSVRQINDFIRSDSVAWLEGNHTATCDFFAWMEQLRLGLNRRLFLGLFDYESHYAWYQRGTFYKKHVDAFKGRTNRVISTVFYLNPGWVPEDGGELVIYDRDGDQVLQRVAPQYGKLVLFLSEDFPHEVLPVNRPRYSIAGWFRVNNSIRGTIDPSR